MKKLIAATLIAATALSGFAILPASAEPAPVVCTSSTVDAQAPSGSYTDKNGRKWVGFKPDGTPPDSLSKDSTKVTCEEPDWT